MSGDRAGFYWHGRDSGASFEKRGHFHFEEVVPFLQGLTEDDACLLICLPGINLDFTTFGVGKIAMEIHEADGMYVAVVKPAVAEEALRRACENWDGDMLSSKLSDLLVE